MGATLVVSTAEHIELSNRCVVYLKQVTWYVYCTPIKINTQIQIQGGSRVMFFLKVLGDVSGSSQLLVIAG